MTVQTDYPAQFDNGEAQKRVIVAVAAVLATSWATSQAMGAAVATAAGYTRGSIEVMEAILGLMGRIPGWVTKPTISVVGNGYVSAVYRAQRQEHYFRAAYLLNGVKRVSDSVRNGATLKEALNKEKAYYQSHLTASLNRYRVAKEIDRAVANGVGQPIKNPKNGRVTGVLLGWHAILDIHTSPECRTAHGNNFIAGVPTIIGYPGSVHPHCRCSPGRPFVGGKMVNRVLGERGGRR